MDLDNIDYDLALCQQTYEAARAFFTSTVLPACLHKQWLIITNMLKAMLATTIQFDKNTLTKTILELEVDGVFSTQIWIA